MGGLNGVPNDPNLSNEVTGLKGATDSTNSIKSGNYAYLVMDKNSITNNGFVLMARVETEGGANWVYDKDSTDNTGKRVIGDNINDISNIHLCTNFSDSGAENKATNDDAGNCSYGSVSQLRYVLAF
ncbi:MAG: hypothetical protein LBG59_08710 [Candidatus Peribacteria bacterium]|nr:hypothetical protein [Candidatus Peribacteria bacterium]